jgi:hypothetical protein
VSQQAKDNRVMPSPEIFLKAMKKVDIEFPDLDIKTVRFYHHSTTIQCICELESHIKTVRP